MAKKRLSIPTLRRLPLYYNIVRHAVDMGEQYISSSNIADVLNIDPTQVRKDIAAIGYGGKPKIGFNTKELAEYLRTFLGFDKQRNIIIVGAGNLGIALAKYEGFANQGMKIKALFDVNPNMVGAHIAGKDILSMDELESYIKDNDIKIVILTVPAKAAQNVANKLFSYGIEAVWNFAPVNISHPRNVLVWNHDLVASFVTFLQLIPGSPGAASDIFSCVKDPESICKNCDDCAYTNYGKFSKE